MTARRMAWRFAAAFWFLFGLISGIQVWISMIAHGHSVPRLLGYYLLVWEFWLVPTMGILWLARRFPVIPPRRLPILIHVLAANVIGVVHGLYWMGLLILLKPYDRMTAELSQSD